MTGLILLVVGSLLLLTLVVVYGCLCMSGLISRDEEAAGNPEYWS